MISSPHGIERTGSCATLGNVWSISAGYSASPDGCAWDRAQTPESLAPFLIEETHEVFDALACGDPAKLSEEIGDALYSGSSS